VHSTPYPEIVDLAGASAVVLSGSFAPWSAHDPGALERLREVVCSYGGPVLGICAGMQLQAMFAGGTTARVREHPAEGFRIVDVDDDGLFTGLPGQAVVYEHHSDEVVESPPGARVIARSATCATEALAFSDRRWWGTQFHPEEFGPEHPDGEGILRNFFRLAGLPAR